MTKGSYKKLGNIIPLICRGCKTKIIQDDNAFVKPGGRGSKVKIYCVSCAERVNLI